MMPGLLLGPLVGLLLWVLIGVAVWGVWNLVGAVA